MTSRVGVLIHGGPDGLGDAVVGAVAGADGLGELRAVEQVRDAAQLAPALTRLGEVCDTVVGVGALPFPGLGAVHEQVRELLGDLPYWAIESWHGLPAFHAALGAELPAVEDATKVLVTAPDQLLRPLPPEHRVVLRDVAAALATATGRRPTIAVDRSPALAPVTPTAVTAVATLAEAHGVQRVVRCSLVPGDGPDEDVAAAAEAAGVVLTDVAIDREAHVAVLVAAIETMVAGAVAAGGAR